MRKARVGADTLLPSSLAVVPQLFCCKEPLTMAKFAKVKTKARKYAMRKGKMIPLPVQQSGVKNRRERSNHQEPDEGLPKTGA